MKTIKLNLPENLIPVKESLVEAFLKERARIYYLYSPPGYGKTTTILRWINKLQGINPYFIQTEKEDKDLGHMMLSLIKFFFSFNPERSKVLETIDPHELSTEKLFTFLSSETSELKLPDNGFYVFLDPYLLQENFERAIREYIFPLISQIPGTFVIEGNQPLSTPEATMVLGTKDFCLGEEDLKRLESRFDIKLSPYERDLLLEKTEGWILPIILFFQQKEKQDIVQMDFSGSFFEDLMDKSLNYLSVQERSLLLGASQLKELNNESLNWILGIDNPFIKVSQWQNQGFFILEEKRNGDSVWRFHRLVRAHLERKLTDSPSGMSIFFRIHRKAMEYYSAVGDYEYSFYHAVKAMKYDSAGKFLKQCIYDIMKENHTVEFLELIGEMGEKTIEKYPLLAMGYGYYLFYKNDSRAIKYFEKALPGLEKQDKLEVEYFLTALYSDIKGNQIVFERGPELLKKLKEIPSQEFIEDYEKDPWKIVRRKGPEPKEKWFYLMKGRIHNMLANAYSTEGELLDAEKHYVLAFNYLNRIRDLRRILTVSSNLSIIYTRKGNYQKAMDMLEEVIDFLGDIPIKGSAYLNLSRCVLHFKRDVQLAQEYIDSALKIHRKFNNIQGQASAYDHLYALSLFYRNDVKSAEMFLEKVGEVIKKEQLPVRTAYYQITLIEFYLETGKTEKAQEILESIDREIIQISKELYYIFKFYEGRVFYETGKREKGKRLMQERLSYFEKCDRDSLLILLKDMFRIYKKYNDPAQDLIQEKARSLIRELKIENWDSEFDL